MRFCCFCVDLYKQVKGCIIQHMREVYLTFFLGFLGLFGYFTTIAVNKYDENGLTESVILLGVLCVILVIAVIFLMFQAIKYGRIHDQKQIERDKWNMPRG